MVYAISKSDIDWVEESGLVLKISYNGGFKVEFKWQAAVYGMDNNPIRPKIKKDETHKRFEDINDAIHHAVQLAKKELK